MTMATMTPTTTPMARLWVATTTATVATMTRVSLLGIRRRVAGRTLCQSKVPTETMIMTATRAAIGMTADDVAEADDEDEQEDAGQEGRDPGAGAGAFTLIMVWPIMAQPPMPPKKPVTMLATPWPQASRVLCEWVSVMSSTSLAVISDSISPTRAMARAYGPMIGQRVEGERHVRAGTGWAGCRAACPCPRRWARRCAASTVTTVRRDDGDQRRGHHLGEPGQDRP